ncbi:hypothetical protein OEZ86_010926 [Tetradesmus obliquus]|uniref:Uncharacterized protein n=2 Tax=Tetradesmus obliquus TaxID=3088 RepID=A0ABY8TIU6_TETOB|nr:hypothetical protein OEZ85_007760 [Tetradesmus obliquus]WIA28380.1 hypothetical protein OEZ86_010926 [Tetradesmus obliquus]|eukprot:jgi/Sobl393_1/10446/SZX63573.1
MDTQKECYRKYLESAGVIDALTKVLVSLYEEPDKPKSAIDYVKACLGGPTPAEYDALIAERESLKKELEDARQQIAELQAKVQAQQ